MTTRKTFLSLWAFALLTSVVVFISCSDDNDSKSKWTIYTVTFDSQGGDSTPEPQEVLSGYTIKRPSPDITKGDSILLGWFTGLAEITEFDFATHITENMTLYAKWDLQDKWYVNFNSQGGSYVPAQEIEIGSNGYAVLPEPYPTKENASFGGWYTDATFTERFDFAATAINRNYTLHARWLRAGMMYVQGGTFTMGRDEDISVTGSNPETPVAPAHQVTVSDFIIGVYEVTNTEFVAFLNDKSVPADGSVPVSGFLSHNNPVPYYGSTLSTIPMFSNHSRGYTHNGTQWTVQPGLDDYPARDLSWYGALAYCEWAGGRLPSEAEWEFAAGGGNKTQGYTYIGGETPDELGWFDGTPHAKGQKTPNELGLYDMAGSLWEWCWDGAGSFSSEPQTNPFRPDTYPTIVYEYGRVVKGGVWSGTNAIRPYTRNFSGTAGDEIDGVRLLIP